MKPLRKKVMDMVGQPVFAGIVIFIVVSIVVFILNRITETDLSDFVVEMNGMLMDILLFAVVIVWLYKRQEKAIRLRNYYEQLEDFRHWRSEEGVHRKVGILSRLQGLDAPFPSLRRFELSGAYLQGWQLDGLNLSMTNLEGAFMLDVNLKETNLEDADLEKAYLQNARLDGANLKNAYLGWVDLRSANLSHAQLLCANVENAALWQADLNHANCEGAFFDGADFTNADLSHAIFLGVDFGRANLRNAKLEATDLGGADLSQADSLTRELIEAAYVDATTKMPPELFAHQEELVQTCSQLNLPEPVSSFPSTRPPHRKKDKRKIWTQSLDSSLQS